MKRKIPVILWMSLRVLMECHAASTEVYFNDFENPTGSLNDFLLNNVGGSQSQFSIGITNGELRIAPGSPEPSGAYAAISTDRFLAPYSNVLSNSPGLVTWAFNVWNQDGVWNSSFFFAVASSSPDALVYSSSSYFFQGGGMVGDRMALFRQTGPPYGGPSSVPIIDIPNGLGTFPQVGSFRITFDPALALWSLYGETSTEATDPRNVSTLLGTATDRTLTGISLPYMSLIGTTSGLASFDNVSVTVADPSVPTLAMELAGTSAVLSWSTDAPGYILQSSTNLLLPTSWSAVTNAVLMVGNNFVVNLSAPEETKFFRLKR